MQTTPPCLALSAVVMSQHNDRGSTAYSLQAPRPTGAAAEVLPQRQKHQIYWCAPRWESFTVIHRASEHSTAKFPFQGSFLHPCMCSIKAPSRVWWLTCCLAIFEKGTVMPQRAKVLPTENINQTSLPSIQDDVPQMLQLQRLLH